MELFLKYQEKRDMVEWTLYSKRQPQLLFCEQSSKLGSLVAYGEQSHLACLDQTNDMLLPIRSFR